MMGKLSPMGEGRPDPTVSPRIAGRHFVPLLPLNAYALTPALPKGEGRRKSYLVLESQPVI
jgi:hypothetical protein